MVVDANDPVFWWEEHGNVRLRDDKAVVKLLQEDDTFCDSVHIPTEYWPLNGRYELFHYRNTMPVADPQILDIFDSIPYQIGHCYANAGSLAAALRERGYRAICYAGWLFTSVYEYPVHHCWVVLETEEGKSVLDLSDDQTIMFAGENAKNFQPGLSQEQAREVIAGFIAAAVKEKNHIRCAPVGTPTPYFLYIGCPCNNDAAITTYNKLAVKYPRHKSIRNLDETGKNATQRLLADMGLMP